MSTRPSAPRSSTRKRITAASLTASLAIPASLALGALPALAAEGASPDTATTAENTPTTIDVLKNDAPGLTLVSLDTSSTVGTATIQGSSVSYTPKKDFSGADSFSYTAKDAQGAVFSARVDITVTPSSKTSTLSTTPTSTSPNSAPPTSTTPSSSALKTTPPAPSTPPATSPATSNPPTATPSTRLAPRFTPSIATSTPAPQPDRATTDATHPVTFSLTANDQNVDPRTVSLTSQPLHGSAVLTSGGSVTYTPDGTYSGTADRADSFTYTVKDPTDTSTSAPTTVQVDVYPVATAASASVPSGVSTTLYPLQSDHGSFNPASLTLTQQPAQGSAVANADGTVTYTASSTFSGSDSFSYDVTDLSGNVVSARFSLSVLPHAKNDFTTVPFNAPSTQVDVLGNDAGAGLRITGVDPTSSQGGTITIAPDALSVYYTPPTDYAGPDPFSYTIADSFGHTSTAHVFPTVSPLVLATPPSTTADTSSTNALTPVPIDVLHNDSHYDPASVSITTQPAHGLAATNPDGTLTYTPDGTYSGNDSASDTFTYTVKDPSDTFTSEPTTVSVAVTPVAVDDSATVSSGTPTPLAVLRNDHGSLDPTTLAIASPPSHGTASPNPDGTLTYTSDTAFSGTDTFSYKALDYSGQEVLATVSLAVDPLANPDSFTLDENSGGTSLDVLKNDYGSHLAIDSASLTSAQGGIIAVDDTHTHVLYYPPANYTGPDSFSYSLVDTASGKTSSTTVSLTVNPLPVPTTSPDSATTPDPSPVTIDVLKNDSGYDPSTVQVVTQPMHGTASANPDGTITYTPTDPFSGTDHLGYVVRSPEGGYSTPTEVSVSVTPVGVEHDFTTPVNTRVSLTGLDQGNHASTSPPSFPFPPSSSVTSTPAHGTISYASTGYQGKSSYPVYTPSPNFSGFDTLTYSTTDSSGQPYSGTALVDTTPQAHDDFAQVGAGSSATEDVLANDSGSLDPSTLTITSDLSHGRARVENGKISIFVSSIYSGPDSLTYSVKDTAGQTTSATLHLDIVPVANPDSFSPHAGTSTVLTPLQNDTGDLSKALLSITTSPSHGSLTQNPDHTLTYTPSSGYLGPDSFAYTLTVPDTSQTGGPAPALSTPTYTTPPATVSLTVVSPLVTRDDSATTPANTPVTVDELKNDSDSTNSRASVRITKPPLHGSAVVNPDYTITYTPTANTSDVDSLVYEVSDAAGFTSSATVTFTVTPTTTPQSYSVQDGTTAPLDILSRDAGSFDPTSLTLTSNPLHGTVVVRDGKVYYTPSGSYVGADRFLYSVKDSSGQSTSGSVDIQDVPAPAEKMTPTPIPAAPSGPSLAYTGGPLGLLGLLSAGLTSLGLYLRRRR